VRAGRLCALLTVVLFATGCGDDATSEPSATVEAESELAEFPDRDVFASNVKYDPIDALINRGAEAPVLDDISCTWASETVADCTTTGYDNAAELSNCGYALLPCGPFKVEAHPECADPQGHDCQIEMDVRATAG
jgi:hypothetical protein